MGFNLKKNDFEDFFLDLSAVLLFLQVDSRFLLNATVADTLRAPFSYAVLLVLRVFSRSVRTRHVNAPSPRRSLPRFPVEALCPDT